MQSKFLKLIFIVLLLVTSLYASDANVTIVPTKHNKKLTLGDIAEIQAGLGTIMIEFGHRFYIAYYSAKAGNWELADYEIEELLEAQEVAEVTRPKYTKQLKEFEDSAIKNLQKAIEAKDWKLFDAKYKEATKACNLCHKSTGHGYIQYQLPKEPPKYLKMTLK